MHFEPSQSGEAFVSRLPGHSVWVDQGGLSVRTAHGTLVRLDWVAAESGPLEGRRRLSSQSHYLRPNQERTHVPHFSQVSQTAAFSGVDVVYYGNHGRLEFDFVVEAGASPDAIAIRVEGAAARIDPATGDLILETDADELRSLAPVVYQEIAGVREPIAGRYRIDDHGLVRFALADYDQSAELVIDPVLEYATYLAGDDDDGAFGIAIGPDGMAFVTGFAEFAEDGPSAQFPTTPGAFDTEPSGEAGSDEVEYDAFVLKLNEDASALVWSTFLGGQREDVGRGIAVGADGSPVVVGLTRSQPFPTTSGALNRSRGGPADGFAAKLSADGSQLVWSTLVGGSATDTAYAVALTDAGMPVVVGRTASDDFPTSSAGLQGTKSGLGDAFVSTLSADGTALAASTLLGGLGEDSAFGVDLDAEGSVYVVGSTKSDDFPTTAGAFQPGSGDDEDDGDAFVAKLPAALDELSYSTFFGGGDDDWANAVAVATDGRAHIAGYTESGLAPTHSTTTTAVRETPSWRRLIQPAERRAAPTWASRAAMKRLGLRWVRREIVLWSAKRRPAIFLSATPRRRERSWAREETGS